MLLDHFKLKLQRNKEDYVGDYIFFYGKMDIFVLGVSSNVQYFE